HWDIPWLEEVHLSPGLRAAGDPQRDGRALVAIEGIESAGAFARKSLLSDRAPQHNDATGPEFATCDAFALAKVGR
ncbi:hypothetical protein, partial [Serratia marcescens]|uniref:hypothetical protein n=1 Tax=Serratia marcescens TaxID=615 RepID=UPI0019545D18